MVSRECSADVHVTDRVVGVALHKQMHLIDACADVLNEEWPRSLTARCHMLAKSCGTLPYCIVMCIEPGQKVIGHSRLCLVHDVDQACFIDSVVVSKIERCKGYGRKLMSITEEHALMLGFKHMYLTTHNKQRFYQHCGYTYCETHCIVWFRVQVAFSGPVGKPIW